MAQEMRVTKYSGSGTISKPSQISNSFQEWLQQKKENIPQPLCDRALIPFFLERFSLRIMKTSFYLQPALKWKWIPVVLTG